MTMTARRYRMVPGIPFSWESQRDQYPADHEPGFRFTVGHVELAEDIVTKLAQMGVDRD